MVKMLTKRNNMRFWGTMVAALGATSLLSGCHLDMWIQPKERALGRSEFFSDQQSSRPLVPGTVSQGALRLADAYHSGLEANGKPTKTIPATAVRSFESPKEMLLRGQEKYNVYCQPCHGKNGNGDGMIMQRGLGYWQKVAASYHTDRIRKIEDGHIYDVITNGYGVMYGYGARIQDVNDRWAIVSYIRALQRAEAGVPSTPELEQKVKESATNEDPSAGINPEEPAGMSRAGEMMKDRGTHGGNRGANGE